MKLPRDLYGHEFVQRLTRYGYEILHQSGSHIIIRTQLNGEHTLSVPNHKPLKIGTLNALLTAIANHFDIEKSEVLERVMARRA